MKHGWIGWSQYFKEYGRTIDVLPNRDSYTGEIYKDAKINVHDLINYISIYEQIEKASTDVKAYEINPSHCVSRSKRNINADTIKILCDSIEAICKNPDKNFIDTLSQGERFIFLKIICGTVAANRQVSRAELLYLKEMALKYEVSGESLANMIKSADRKTLIMQARMITDRAKALTLIKDMCMVSNIDNNLDDHEIDYILDIAEAMNIEPDRVKDINNVVNEYLAVSQKACVLLEQEHWT